MFTSTTPLLSLSSWFPLPQFLEFPGKDPIGLSYVAWADEVSDGIKLFLSMKNVKNIQYIQNPKPQFPIVTIRIFRKISLPRQPRFFWLLYWNQSIPNSPFPKHPRDSILCVDSSNRTYSTEMIQKLVDVHRALNILWTGFQIDSFALSVFIGRQLPNAHHQSLIVNSFGNFQQRPFLCIE